MHGLPTGSQLLPWEHAAPKLRCRDAEAWLTRHKRSVKRVHAVERAAVFYESPHRGGSAVHQPWRLDKANTLVPDGPPRSGWPVYV